MTQQNKYVLYLGLADKDTKKQQITISKAMRLVNRECIAIQEIQLNQALLV